MKVLILFIVMHLLAAQFVRAQEAKSAEAPGPIQEPVKTDQVTAKPDECKEVLPAMESLHQQLETEYRELSESAKVNQDNYLISFNDMTNVLFALTEARVQETAKITASRDQLSEAIAKFHEANTAETSTKLKEQYFNLTSHLFTAALDSQKIVEALKAQMTQVESTRTKYTETLKDMELIDQEKLALEAKLISAKIKCQPQKKYRN